MRIARICIILLIFSCHPKSDPLLFNVMDFGAVGDGDSMDAPSIQKAIDAAEDRGGGTVCFPPGVYLSGTIYLKSNVSVLFESGAKLVGSKNLDDYNGEKKSYIQGQNLQNVKISGKGIIDGNGDVYWDENFKALERPEPWILFKNCSNITIEDVKLTNSPSHVIRLEDSNDVTFDDITIINDFRGPNTDGIDIVDSKNVTVSNSYISTGDDAICLKTRKKAVENVVVTNCILESDDAAIKFGTGSKVATRFCNFSNITIRRTRYGISFFMLDGGIYEHNQFSNITIEGGSRHKHEYPIFIDIDKRVADRAYGRVRNNTFSNIKIVSTGKVLVSGHQESNIESIAFKNVSFHLTEDEDFSESNKPRGNKKYPKLESSEDLSRENGVFVFGHVGNLIMKDASVSYNA
ncbi:MAG: glycosyl hydrolase family 28 protein [Bacteroidota bacterium]